MADAVVTKTTPVEDVDGEQSIIAESQQFDNTEKKNSETPVYSKDHTLDRDIENEMKTENSNIPVVPLIDKNETSIPEEKIGDQLIDQRIEMSVTVDKKLGEQTFEMSGFEEKPIEATHQLLEIHDIPGESMTKLPIIQEKPHELTIEMLGIQEKPVDQTIEIPVIKENTNEPTNEMLITQETIEMAEIENKHSEPTIEITGKLDEQTTEMLVIDEQSSKPTIDGQVEIPVIDDKFHKPTFNKSIEISSVKLNVTELLPIDNNLKTAIPVKEKAEQSSSSGNDKDSTVTDGLEPYNFSEPSTKELFEKMDQQFVETSSSDRIQDSDVLMTSSATVDDSESNVTEPSEHCAINSLSVNENETLKNSENINLATVSTEHVSTETLGTTIEHTEILTPENEQPDSIFEETETSQTADMEENSSERCKQTVENNHTNLMSGLNSELIPNIEIKLEFQDSNENQNFEDGNAMSTDDSTFIKSEIPDDVEMMEGELANGESRKQIKGRIERVEGNVIDEERTLTMLDVLQEQQELEEDADAVLGASDDKNCTYIEGYIKRQALYACLTCCSEARNNPTKRAGVCLACSLSCHENHELIELYTKRNFRCDCGNPNFEGHLCNFTKDKNELNNENKYNQNFSGLYCICHRPYPDPESTVDDEMIQCIVCEDWLHASHLESVVPDNDQYSEMICKMCMDKNEFLNDYTSYAIIIEQNESIDIINGNGTFNLNGSQCETNAVEKADTIIQREVIVNPKPVQGNTQDQLNEINENVMECDISNDGPTCQITISEVTSNAKCDIETSKEIQMNAETSVSLDIEETNNAAESTANANENNMEIDNCQEKINEHIPGFASVESLSISEKLTGSKLTEDMNPSGREENVLKHSEGIVESELHKDTVEFESPNDTSKTTSEEELINLEERKSEILTEPSKLSEETENQYPMLQTIVETELIPKEPSETPNDTSKTLISEETFKNLEEGKSEVLEELGKTSEETENKTVATELMPKEKSYTCKEINLETEPNDYDQHSTESINFQEKPNETLSEQPIENFKVKEINATSEFNISSAQSSETSKESLKETTETLNEISQETDKTNELNSFAQSIDTLKEPSKDIAETHEVTNNFNFAVQSTETLQKCSTETIEDHKITNETDSIVQSSKTDEVDEEAIEAHEITNIIEIPVQSSEAIESLEEIKKISPQKQVDTETLINTPESNISKETEESFSMDQSKINEIGKYTVNIDVEMSVSDIKETTEVDAEIVDSRDGQNIGIEKNVLDLNVNVNEMKDTNNVITNDITINPEKEIAQTDRMNDDSTCNEINNYVEGVTNKRKISVDTEDPVNISSKKSKINDNCDVNDCKRPKQPAKRIKGATFWPCNWRQKLCSCSNCVSMYKNKDVLFLLDLEDTVTAYEELGKAKSQGKTSQYEKGLAALSSLDRIQQINALTEYNRMKNELLNYLISFKNRQEVVKVEDIERFFSDIKPKKKSDGVYFCR